MVRVLDVSPDRSVVKEIVCRKGCGARLEYVPNDVKSWHGKDYSGGAAGCEYIVCPNCGKDVNIKCW